MTRAAFVYRIEVVYPTDPATGETLPPNNAGDGDGTDPYFEDGSSRGWPRVKMSLSRAAAERRANLLVERGAVSATVIRSLPVGWPE